MTDPKFRALVVEDEWPARNYLVELLEATGRVEIVGAVASLEEASSALVPESELRIDIAFLDVNLAGSGDDAGIRLARRVANTSGAPALVLATAFSKHALEAFELGVVDYLLKPFTDERVAACLDRVAERRPAAQGAQAKGRIAARNGKSLVFLDIEEVWAFEASERLTYVHTLHGKFDLDLSLASIESTLGRSFCRVHRSWLVNVPFIREFGRDSGEHMLFVGQGITGDGSGITVPVARDRASAIREMLLSSSTGLRR